MNFNYLGLVPKCLAPMLLIVFLPACGPYYARLYNLELQQTKKTLPQEKILRVGADLLPDGSAQFSDEFIEITWKLERHSLGFVLKNNTNKTVKLPWDDAVYVDQNGNSNRVIHTGVRYLERDKAIPPSVIIAHGKITDAIIPANLLHYSLGQYGGWRADPLVTYETTGQDISVLIPLIIGETRHEYLFIMMLKVERHKIEHPQHAPGGAVIWGRAKEN